MLDELAKDVHLWSLRILLSLVKGELSYYLKLYHLSYHRTIENVQTTLQHKGLTSFDKNTSENSRAHRFAVKACIELTLQLLTNHYQVRLRY